MPLLLAPERLVEKEIGGVKITCRDLVEYFKVRLLPTPRSAAMAAHTAVRRGAPLTTASLLSEGAIQNNTSLFAHSKINWDGGCM